MLFNNAAKRRFLTWPSPASIKILVALAVVVIALLQVGVALAHARLKSANIQPDATIATVPATLTLTFTEETSPTDTKLQVLDASGKAVDKGDLKVNGDTATISLGTLSNGKYTVKFRTFTEDDSNTVDGQYSFTIATGGTASAGNVTAVNQVEGNAPKAVPAAGIGGGSTQDDSGPLVPLLALSAVLILASAGLLVSRRRQRRP